MDKEGKGEKLEAWDWWYYTEKDVYKRQIKWSPFLPDDSGVSPFPYFCNANMDLQI